MNKKHILLILLLFTSNLLLSQKIGRDIISASGGVLTETGLQLSWTIGQSGLAGTMNSIDLILTQGFEQENDDQLVAIINIDHQEVVVDLFPNPVMTDASLKINSELTAHYSWILFDCNGLPVIKSQNQLILADSIIEKIPSNDLKPGMYYLQVFIFSSGKTKILDSIKLIKI
jgi:hypothetical protein